MRAPHRTGLLALSDSLAGSAPQNNNTSLLKSSAVVSAMTMISRVLGLLRDIIFAPLMGAAGNADAFFVAFKIPNFFRRLFAEGAFAQAFVPVLAEYRANGSSAAVRHFIDRVAGCLGVSLAALTALVVLASPVFTAIFGIGFYLDDANPEKFWLTADLLRITFPYLLLISLTGLAGAILNSYDQFAVPAFTPVFLNIALIVAALVAAPYFSEPAFALAWGVLVAGVIQCAFPLPFLLRLGLLPHPVVDWSDESVRKVLRLMAPAMFGVSVSQINLMFDTILASFLPTGSISWLYFSDRLVELPLGVFGVGIATVILPNLSRLHASGAQQFSATIDWALKMILLIALPAAVALVVLAKPLLFTLFQYGKYSPRDVAMASLSLQAYALGLTAFMLIKVLVSGFFSRQDMKTPVRIGVIAMLANMGLNVVFVLPLHFMWQVGHVGLALATAASAFLNAGLLFVNLRRQGVYREPHGWGPFCMRALFANGLMLAVLLILSGALPEFAPLSWWQRCAHLAVFVLAGLATYVGAMWLGGLRPRHLRLELR